MAVTAALGEVAQFSVVDYVLFSLMLVVSLGIGVWSAVTSRGKESTQEYLLGGRAMSPVPVAISLLGGIISAISILGNATEMYLNGTQLCMSLVGVVFGSLFIHQVTLPVFYDLKLVSVTQYLEMRYDSRALHKLGFMCQILTKFFYMGICLYAPSLALSTVTSLSTNGSMILMGLICTFYITVGGVKAVVYTDVMQTLLMLGGVLLVVVICCIDLGGLDKVWAIASQGSRIEFFNMDPSPFVRHTFWSTIVLGFYITVNILGVNQSSYQRFASVGSLAMAQRLSMSFIVGLWILWGVFFLSGLVAYAAYSHCDPLTSGRIEKADQIIPYLVMEKLGHLTGIPGIFVAAVYGGVLSSLSTCGNSIACLIWEDILKNFQYFRKMSDVAATRVLKIISVLAGLSGILLGMLMSQLGNIFAVMNSFSGTVMSPIQGVFFGGILQPWTNSKGALCGFLVSFSYNVFVVLGKFLFRDKKGNHLPLLVDWCPENLANSTFTPAFDNASLSYDTEPPTDTPYQDQLPGSTVEGLSVYDISYCYYGVTGIMITLVVSSLVSLCTGPLRPGELDERLVDRRCLRLHWWAWRAWCGGRGAVVAPCTDPDAMHAMISLPHAKPDSLSTS